MDRMRMMLFGVLLMGVGGIWAELLLTSHTGEFWQKFPIVLLSAAFPLIVITALRPAAWAVLLTRVLMMLFILAGLLGTFFHYESNAEFAAELSPGLSGFALLTEAFTRATPPPLAPGTMIMLGLLGLVCCYRIRAAAPGRAQGE